MRLDEAKKILKKSGYKVENDFIPKNEKAAIKELVDKLELTGLSVEMSGFTIHVYDYLKHICDITYGNKSFDVYVRNPYPSGKEFRTYSSLIDYVNRLW
jgi:hypothetical protein